MHYELYIDLLFLENFMMDSLLLLVLNRVLKCKSNWQRIFLGGGLGSGMMCLGIVVGIPGVFQLIFFHGIVSSCMLITGLRIRTKAQFIKAYILLYLFKVYQPFLWVGSGNGISLCEMLETVKKNKRKRTGAV